MSTTTFIFSIIWMVGFGCTPPLLLAIGTQIVIKFFLEKTKIKLNTSVHYSMAMIWFYLWFNFYMDLLTHRSFH